MRATAFHLSIWLMFGSLSFGQGAASTTSGNAVASVAGQPISEQELLDTIGPQQLMQLRTQEYEIRSKALENLIRLKLVQIEAKKRAISPENLIEQEVDSKLPAPSDSEVEAYFWGQNTDAGARFEDVKEQYRTVLKRLRIQKARQVYADSLRKNIDVAVLMSPPSTDVAYDPTRVKGDPKAKVTVVEFADFQCPFCKKTEATLKEVLAKYNGRVKLAYLDFPLREIHPQAETAAEAARCAGEQGKFWEFHDALYSDASRLKESDLIEDARTLKLDQKSFASCLQSRKYEAKIEADLEKGRKAGVAGTPSFFINGVFLNGALPQADFERVIDSQLRSLEQH